MYERMYFVVQSDVAALEQCCNRTHVRSWRNTLFEVGAYAGTILCQDDCVFESCRHLLGAKIELTKGY